MSLIEAIVQGIFQGVAEFLPISSSGHLALLQHMFNIKEGNLFFVEMLHFGTLISIIVVYFRDILIIVKEMFVLVGDIIKGRRRKLTSHQKLGMFVLTGSIPTAIIGLAFEDFFASLYTSLLPIGIALIATGILLFIAEKNTYQDKSIKEMTLIDSIIIGTIQGLAIIPGISRSGSTIVAGLFRGMNKSLATEYSFLLALPATFGAFLLGLRSVFKESANSVMINAPLIIGVVLSAIVGIISIKLLIKMLKNNKLHYFSYYLWVVGSIIIITQLV